MRWSQSLQEDRGRIWTDYLSDCCNWRIEQGHSVEPDQVWALFHSESGKMRWHSFYRTLSEAKAGAEAAAEAQNKS
jgi:hypothetical protein